VFDLSRLTKDPNIEIDFVAPENGIMPASILADHDALILLFPRFARESIPAWRPTTSAAAQGDIGPGAVDRVGN